MFQNMAMNATKQKADFAFSESTSIVIGGYLSVNITVNFLVWKGVISISRSQTHWTDLKMQKELCGNNKRILPQNEGTYDF